MVPSTLSTFTQDSGEFFGCLLHTIEQISVLNPFPVFQTILFIIRILIGNLTELFRWNISLPIAFLRSTAAAARFAVMKITARKFQKRVGIASLSSTEREKERDQSAWHAFLSLSILLSIGKFY